MQKDKQESTTEKRTIWFSSLVSILSISAFFVFFPEINSDKSIQTKTESCVSLLELPKNKEIGFDEIHDYSPLFIPTRWNSKRKPQEIVQPINWNFDKVEKYEYADLLKSSNFLLDENASFERGKNSITRAFMRRAFLGYARKDSQNIYQNNVNLLTFSLIDLNTGKKIKSESFKSDISKNMFSIGEFKVSIENDGWIIAPLVLQSTGNEKSDSELSKMLTPSKLLKNVPAGNYKAIFVP